MSHFINHIAIVVDASSSMSGLEKRVVEVFDSQIGYLKSKSVEMDQETRVSVYTFGDTVKNVVFDQDVMRTKSLKGLYSTQGMTALLDATGLSITDMKTLPELYGDHAFLVYVITDGGENRSRKYDTSRLKVLIDGLPDNWTVIAQVPNAYAMRASERCGFSKGNIEVWDTTDSGFQSATSNFKSSLNNYMTLRSTGVRGTKSFFTTDLASVTKTAVVKNLDQLSPSKYETYPVSKESPIKEFLEKRTGRDYVLGSAYYELMKKEDIQAYKQIAIQNRKDGKVYTGDQARGVLGLPNYEVKVSPGDHGDWRIFVQSTSVNRKLIPGTQVMVML